MKQENQPVVKLSAAAAPCRYDVLGLIGKDTIDTDDGQVLMANGGRLPAGAGS